MALVKFNPFRELEEMQNRLHRFFGEPAAQRPGDAHDTLVAWAPAVDVQVPEVKKKMSKWSCSTGR